ncbi:MAG: polyprenyl synthetase family protein [Mailhella sp.]
MVTFLAVLKYEQSKVNSALTKELEAMPAPLRDIAGHVLLAGGKRLRPLMTLASARLFGAEGPELYELAVIPEMIHVATLLHDDVLDGASSRRGKASAHVLYDVPRAILAGDALLAAASHKTASFGIPALLECVSQSVLMTAAGETHEIALQRSLSHSFQEYVDIIAGKTGWLIRGSCRLGALYAGASSEDVEAVSDYGLNLGIAFQMVDDALDFADEAVTGKPCAGDLEEGKFTPPIMKYLEFLPRCDRENFCEKFRTGRFSPEERMSIAADIRRLGFDAEARAMADEYLDKASQSLDKLPQRCEQKLFREALEFVRSRKS